MSNKIKTSLGTDDPSKARFMLNSYLIIFIGF